MSLLRRAGSAAVLALFTVGLTTTGALAGSLSGTGDAARNTGDATEDLRASIVDSGARNVILLIGDGMGDSEITIARNYAYGAAGAFPGIDALPITGDYTTYSIFNEGEFRGLPDYMPDSAATATAWATGTKSYDGAIGVDIDGGSLDSLLEIARANGLRTGNVSTATIQDATPAAQVASVTMRTCLGPVATSTTCPTNALENGGEGSISEQLLDSRPDVSLGGGAATFSEVAAAGPWAGQTLFEQAADRGYNVVRTAEELGAVTSIDSPVLGLFTPSHFPTRYLTTTATEGGGDGEAITCQPNPERLSEDLSLAALTTKAIDLLDDPGEDQGFFLQVEGASIDKSDHAADACGQIGETVDLDEAVQVALDFARADGETLVILTADHAHSSQIVDIATPGLSIKLETVEGAPMIVAYGTDLAARYGLDGVFQQHTGTQLRVAAYGPGAANVSGLIDQTDNFFTIANGLGLERDLAALSAGATITSPASGAPGATVQVTVTGLNGDKTATGSLGDVDLGQADVIDGVATFSVVLPDAVGSYPVTIRGVQTGTEVTGTFEVTNDPTGGGTSPTDATPTSPDPTSTSSGAVVPGGGGGGGLPLTGVQVLGVVLIAAALLAGGLVLVRERRQHLLAP